MTREVDVVGKLVTAVDEYLVLKRVGSLFIGTPIHEVMNGSEIIYPAPCVIEPSKGFDFLYYPKLQIKVQEIQEKNHE
jgi:hypothetical protein